MTAGRAKADFPTMALGRLLLGVETERVLYLSVAKYSGTYCRETGAIGNHLLPVERCAWRVRELAKHCSSRLILATAVYRLQAAWKTVR